MSPGDITTIEDAAKAVSLVFKHRGWQWAGASSSDRVPDVYEIEDEIRSLVFHKGFTGEAPDASVSCGRLKITRDEFSGDPNTRSIYLHIADI